MRQHVNGACRIGGASAALYLVAFGLSACAERGTGGAPREDAAVIADATVNAPDASVCVSGATATCVCDTGLGSRTCVDGQWAACGACAPPPDDGKVRCVAGRYRAHTSIAYRPSPAGICFLAAPGEATQFEGDMTFTLDREGNAEFYSVGNGCLRVDGQGEDAGPSDIDWRAEVVGEVDCTTGVLNAEIRATYFVVSVCTLGLVPTRYFAKGPMRAIYNPDTQVFENGTVEMWEPPVLLGGPPGGTGNWTADYEGESTADDLDAGPCLNVPFDDSVFPASSSDAGT
jgi:hypothetical protein